MSDTVALQAGSPFAFRKNSHGGLTSLVADSREHFAKGGRGTDVL